MLTLHKVISVGTQKVYRAHKYNIMTNKLQVFHNQVKLHYIEVQPNIYTVFFIVLPNTDKQ